MDLLSPLGAIACVDVDGVISRVKQQRLDVSRYSIR